MLQKVSVACFYYLFYRRYKLPITGTQGDEVLALETAFWAVLTHYSQTVTRKLFEFLQKTIFGKKVFTAIHWL